MDLNAYKTLRKRWLLASVVAAVTVALIAIVTFLQTPLYRSSAELFVSAGGGSDDSIVGSFQGGQFVQQRVASYVLIVDSPEVLGPVIERLGLETTTSELASQVEASTPRDTVLIQISVTGEDPVPAATIANEVAAEFSAYVEVLEQREIEVQVGDSDTTTRTTTQPVKVSVVKPAEPPGAPFSPQVRVNLVLGAIMGLVLGVGLALLRELMDQTINSREIAQRLTQAPILGTVLLDAETPKKPLITTIQRNAPRAEAFRSMRTNLQYVDVDKPLKSVVITSASPGEGKTTISANIAIAMAQRGQRVLLLEGDLRRPRVADLFGLVGDVGLTNVLVGEVTAHDVLQPVPGMDLFVVTSGPIPPNPSELLNSHQMEKLVAEFGEDFDTVIIDAPPLVPLTDAAILARLADGAVFVIRQGVTRREQVSAGVESLRAVNARLLGVVLNMAPKKDVEAYTYRASYE